MTPVGTCECGARIRLPASVPAGGLRCPQCKRDITPLLQPTKAAATASAGMTCPICHAAIAAGEAVTACDSCGQVHHRECWDEIGGCATYGCRSAPSAPRETPAQTPLSAWGDTKKCPVCGESIKAIAVRCRFCQTDFDTVDPLDGADVVEKINAGVSLKSARTGIIALFVASLTGCLAPLTLIVGLAWFLPKRKMIHRLGPAFTVLAYATIGVSAFYTLLMLVFGLYEAAR